jgi:hypothetical protein
MMMVVEPVILVPMKMRMMAVMTVAMVAMMMMMMVAMTTSRGTGGCEGGSSDGEHCSKRKSHIPDHASTPLVALCA